MLKEKKKKLLIVSQNVRLDEVLRVIYDRISIVRFLGDFGDGTIGSSISFAIFLEISKTAETMTAGTRWSQDRCAKGRNRLH